MVESAAAGSDRAKPAAPRSKSLLVGHVGPVRRQLRKAIAEARAGGRMTTEHEVRALLAERYAAYVDRATSASDGRALLTAGEKLLELLDTLPIRVPGGGGSGDGGDGRGQLHAVLDSSPTVGNGAHS